MKKTLAEFDWSLFILSLIILSFGLAMINSIAASFLSRQLFSAFLAIAFFFFFSFLDYRVFLKVNFLIFAGCLVFLVLPYFFGVLTRGSLRWFQIGGVSLQPSELVKPLLIVFFAGFFSAKRNLGLKEIFEGVGWLGLPVFLIFFQPDLGNSLIVIFLWVGILLAAGLVWRWILAGGILIFSFLPFGWKFLQDYQKQRVLNFITHSNDPLGANYNLIQAVVAVGSGQFWGRGLGRGTQSHLRFLPERHTDFIFASLAEELGFFGAAILILLFGFLLWRILVIAQKSHDRFGFLICIGVFCFLFSQVFINIGINLGLMPVTGIPLPLVSYGGSCLVATMMGLGIVESVARRIR